MSDTDANMTLYALFMPLPLFLVLTALLFIRHRVKISRYAPERRCGARKFKPWSVPAANIIGFHSRNLRSWAQQVINFRYSNPIVNKSFYDNKFTMLNAFTKFCKTEKSRLVHSVDH